MAGKAFWTQTLPRYQARGAGTAFVLDKPGGDRKAALGGPVLRLLFHRLFLNYLEQVFDAGELQFFSSLEPNHSGRDTPSCATSRLPGK
jgi:hypothetical protein